MLSRHFTTRSSTTKEGAEDNFKAMRKRHINRSTRNIEAGRASFHVTKRKTTAMKSRREPWCSCPEQVITARAAPELPATRQPCATSWPCPTAGRRRALASQKVRAGETQQAKINAEMNMTHLIILLQSILSWSPLFAHGRERAASLNDLLSSCLLAYFPYGLRRSWAQAGQHNPRWCSLA